MRALFERHAFLRTFCNHPFQLFFVQSVMKTKQSTPMRHYVKCITKPQAQVHLKNKSMLFVFFSLFVD